MEMQGDRELYRPAFQDNTPAGAEANAAGQAPPPKIVISDHTFGPRVPGQADITIKEEKADESERTETIELLIEETYVGAIRLGIAVVGLGAQDRSHEARAVGGSQQAEVVAKGTGDVDFEFVLGAAPFLFDAPRPSINAGVRVAPYFGVGLLSVDSDVDNADVEFLKSLHAGFELEFVPGFSLAATFVARRVTRLADGVRIGSAVDGNVPANPTVGFGGGLFVVNFSPEFLKIAHQGAGGLF